MKERNLISQLASLRTLQPRADSLARIKSRLDTEHESSFYRPPAKKWLIPASFTGLLAVFVLITSVYFATYRLPSRYLDAENSLSIAVSLPLAPTRDTSIQDLSQALNQANSAMVHLHLKGEMFLYSMSQCQNLYRDYVVYLRGLHGQLDEAIMSAPPERKQRLETLRNQVSEYEEAAEKRLQMYPKHK